MNMPFTTNSYDKHSLHTGVIYKSIKWFPFSYVSNKKENIIIFASKYHDSMAEYYFALYLDELCRWKYVSMLGGQWKQYLENLLHIVLPFDIHCIISLTLSVGSSAVWGVRRQIEEETSFIRKQPSYDIKCVFTPGLNHPALDQMCK